ncbi:hypothetical protein H0H92_013333, partial [Tricholoma furcatifolium]
GKSQATNAEDKDEDTFVIRRSTGVSTPAVPPAGVSQSPTPSPPVAPEPPAAPAPAKVVMPPPVSLGTTATDTTTAAAESPAALDPRSLFDDPNLLTMPELPAEREPSLPPSNQLALRIARPRTPGPAPQTPTRESDPRPRDTLDDGVVPTNYIIKVLALPHKNCAQRSGVSLESFYDSTGYCDK